MGFWGGRFSAIIEASENGPDPAYSDWLRSFDPDIIYSYVDLSDEAVERIHESQFPSYLVRHEFYARGERDFHSHLPKLNIPPLSVTTLLPRAGLPQFDGPSGVRVIDSLGRLGQDPLVRDSFGFFTDLLGHNFPRPLGQYGDVLTLVADEDAQPRARFVGSGTPISKSVADLLLQMANTKIVTMSQLASVDAPRLSLQTMRGGEFNLVVGDSVADRLFYWNARHLFPMWRDGDMVDARIPEAALDDQALVEALAQFLNRRNRVTDHSSNSQPRIGIRSASVGLDRLEALSSALRGKTKGWHYITVGSIKSAADCLPKERELEGARLVMSGQTFLRRTSDWQESRAEGDELQFTPPAPGHFRYCPPTLISPHNGCWAVDVEIERQVNNSLYSNVRQTWRFPKRLRIIRPFRMGFELGTGSHVMPRVNRDGLLTVYSDSGPKSPPIHLPSDERAIFSGFVDGRDWWPFKQKPNAPDGQMPAQLLESIGRSPNGKHFWGVIGLVGGLREAQSLLLHKFWLEIFDLLGGSRAFREARRQALQREWAKW